MAELVKSNTGNGKRTDWLAYAMLAATVLFWSGNIIVGRAVRGDVPPITLALLRWIGATIVIAPFALRGLRADLPALRAGWKPVALLCLTGVAGFNTLVYSGLKSTTATNGLLLQALIPGFVLILGAVLFRRREPTLKIAGIGLSVTGAVFTIFRGDGAAVLALDLGQGDLLVFCACVLWAIYTVVLRFVPKVRPASLLFVTFAGAVMVLIPIDVLAGEGPIRWSLTSVAAIAYVSIFPSVLAYFLYNAAVARAGPAIAGQAITLMPLVGAFLAAAILAEPLHWYHAVGMVLILSGIVLSGRADLRQG